MNRNAYIEIGKYIKTNLDKRRNTVFENKHFVAPFLFIFKDFIKEENVIMFIFTIWDNLQYVFGIFALKMLILSIYKKKVQFLIWSKAIFGHSFCTGAKKAFLLILENALRVAAINSIGDFVLFLGKLSTMAVVLVVGNEFFQVSLNGSQPRYRVLSGATSILITE